MALLNLTNLRSKTRSNRRPSRETGDAASRGEASKDPSSGQRDLSDVSVTHQDEDSHPPLEESSSASGQPNNAGQQWGSDADAPAQTGSDGDAGQQRGMGEIHSAISIHLKGGVSSPGAVVDSSLDHLLGEVIRPDGSARSMRLLAHWLSGPQAKIATKFATVLPPILNSWQDLADPTMAKTAAALSDYRAESADVFFSSGTLDFLPDIEGAITNSARVLSPGGYAVFRLSRDRIVEGEEPPVIDYLLDAESAGLPPDAVLPSMKVGRDWFLYALAREGLQAQSYEFHGEERGRVIEWFVGHKPANPDAKREALTIGDKQNGAELATTPTAHEISATAGEIFPTLSASPLQTTTNRPRARRGLSWSFLVCVVLPVAVSAIYYGFIASDEYMAHSEFAIKTPSLNLAQALAQGAAPGLPRMGLGGAADSAQNASIVREYIESRQVLEDIKPYLDVRKMYSNPKADWFARFNPARSPEEFLAYWRSMVTVHDNALMGYTEFDVRAFTPEDAKAIAERVIHLSEALVNRLSVRAQADAVATSKDEVDKAYQRVMNAREALRKYQESRKQLSPSEFAKTHVEIQGRMEADLSSYRSQLEVFRKNLPEDAPVIVQLKTRIGVIEKQLNAEKLQTTVSPDRESALEMLNDSNLLQVEYDFAEKAYLATLSAQEMAREATLRQTSYLEAFVSPQLPEFSEYPKRWQKVTLTAFLALLIWSIGSLFVATAKEHL